MNAPDRLTHQSGTTIALPTANGGLEAFQLSVPRAFPSQPSGVFTRIAYSAAHVVADPRKEHDPWLDCAIDWDATIAYRRHLWTLGMGVAEAMDTAQRGMGMDWPASLELIRRSIDASKDIKGAFLASGAGTIIASTTASCRR